MNREAWLTAMAEKLWPLILKHGGHKPEKWRVACGWPASGGTVRPGTKRSRTIGQCWCGGSEGGAREIFISPYLADPVEVAETLLHELIHAALDAKVQHRAPFARLAKAAGLEGKPTATHAGDALKAKLTEYATELGEYPHDRLDRTAWPKQGTRMLKLICPDCGYIVRTTSKWLEVGYPTCPCGSMLVPDEEYETDGLNVAHMEQVFRTPDGRFEVRFVKDGRRERWYVLDLHTPEMAVEAADSREDAVGIIDAIREGLYRPLPHGYTRTEFGDVPPLWTDVDEEYAVWDEDEYEDPDFEDLDIIEGDEAEDWLASGL
jgi:hypothetical protein